MGVPNYAVGTLAELFGNVVALINHKLLVEDLEDLAAGEVGHGGLCCSKMRRGRGQRRGMMGNDTSEVCAGLLRGRRRRRRRRKRMGRRKRNSGSGRRTSG